MFHTIMLKVFVPLFTPAVLDMLKQFTKDFYLKAKETPNPWDDILAEFLAGLVGLDVDNL